MSTADLPQPAEPTGILGDGDAHPGKYNMRLARRAIREGWPITPEIRASLVKQMAKTMDADANSERDKIGAAKVIVAADNANLKRAELEIKIEEVDNPRGETPAIDVNVNVDVRQQVLNDPQYLEYLRSRTADANGHAGPVCANGKPGTLETGAPPDVPGPGTNGHHRGS